MRESLIAQIRNPATSFVKRSRAINYGNCYYFQMPELEDLDTLDVDAACDHFNTCYKDPAEFTICLTGQVEVDHSSFWHSADDAAVCWVWRKHTRAAFWLLFIVVYTLDVVFAQGFLVEGYVKQEVDYWL